MGSRGFEQNERSGCVHREIGFRVAGRPVVRGLRGGVNHQFDLVLPKQHIDAGFVADGEVADLVQGFQGRPNQV